jgi:hypothetical protein
VTGHLFVLVHSPVAGPRTWASTAGALGRHGHRAIVPALRLPEEPPAAYWSHFVDQVVGAVEGAVSASAAGGHPIDAVTLVAHSAAGPLLPAIESRLPRSSPGVSHRLFADATVPARTGSTPVVPARYLPFLRELASGGRLPRWSQWFGPEAMAALIPDPDLWAEIEEEMPSLPLASFEESVPVPAGWPSSGCGYLHFSPPYDAEAAEARSRGWQVTHLPGGHFHMAVDPASVAGALLDLATTLRS